MTLWSEFKSVVFPWLIAGLMIGLYVYDNHQSDQRYVDQTNRIAAELDGVKTLLSEQGYRVPPVIGTR